jgi:uncharacterized protein (DUF169 family)
MKLDSEAQRNLLIALLMKVPVRTTMEGLVAGPRPDVKQLLTAIQTAPLEEHEEEPDVVQHDT